MLVLSTKPSEKILLPDSQITLEVVAIQTGSVRLGISSPADVRVLREGAPVCQSDWAPVEPGPDEVPSLPMLRKLLDKRLDIAREGISEARALLRGGHEEDARVLLEKVDEDLHLLRRRVRREFEKAEPMTCGV